MLLNSYQQLTGDVLVEPELDDDALVMQLDAANFALVSHGTQASPVFNYGNQTALDLFEMEWAEFMQMESLQSAEAPNRDERARLLKAVRDKGYIDNYSGVRISKSGVRFFIEAATVWNVTDHLGKPQGQAAMFREWRLL